MEKFIKENKNIVIVCVVILGFLFYWFQIRPIQIKKNCAYTKKVLPAYITKEQVLRCSKPEGGYLYECFNLEKEVKENPSKPTKEIDVLANEKEYNQCLREHGF